jgi:hypothetical protein
MVQLIILKYIITHLQAYYEPSEAVWGGCGMPPVFQEQLKVELPTLLS